MDGTQTPCATPMCDRDVRQRPSQKAGAFVFKDLAEAGWGGRIRTSEWRYQKPLPYHLATPHRGATDKQAGRGWQPRDAPSSAAASTDARACGKAVQRFRPARHPHALAEPACGSYTLALSVGV